MEKQVHKKNKEEIMQILVFIVSMQCLCPLSSNS